MKVFESFQLIVVLAVGAFIGIGGTYTVIRATQAFEFAAQCQQGQASLVKELNEKVMPQIQKEIADLKAATSTKVARK